MNKCSNSNENAKKCSDTTKNMNLGLKLALYVFSTMIVSFILIVLITLTLFTFGIFKFTDISSIKSLLSYFIFGFLCVLFEATFIGFSIQFVLKPIKSVITATHEVAQGNFDTEINLTGVRELVDLSESFNKMTQELKSTQILRSDFINNFSHEFKTPIVSIRGFSKLLKNGNLTEDEKEEYLDIIISESERLAKLSTNILNLSKYESQGIITDKYTFRLDEQIRRIILLTEAKWSEKEINFSINLEKIKYNGNEDLMEQIWINLLDNAIKFSEVGGDIYITLYENSDKIIFSIEDKGIGMDEQVKNHIFEKFYQADASHSGKGNGLGLSIVKRIVDLCNGMVYVQSEIGKGSKFVIMLNN